MPDQDGSLNRHLYAQTHHGRDERHHHNHHRHHHHSDRHHDHAKAQCPPDPFPEDVTAPPKDVPDASPQPPSRQPSNLSCGSSGAETWSSWCPGRLQVISQGDPQKRELAIICLRGKEQKVCRRSLFVFSLNSCFRRHVIELVNWFLFDKFILSLIIFNSLCLASYDYRSESDSGFNWISDNVFDPILTCFFTLEFVLKVIAFGFVLDETSYLRDAWNWLDFIVVVTGILQMTNAMTSTEGVGFLRMFRILRPLRSLNAVPQMKVLVNTVLSSVPRLGNVTLMAAFLFVSFGILGISLFGGVFYRSCRSMAQPLLLGSNGTECWSWPHTGEERLCGGCYLCEDSPLGQKGHCGGHPQDTNEEFRPVFDGGQRGFPWCSGSEPRKVFPESEWISFDHLGTALITIFQCMTLEGWTDVMYRIQDGYGFAVATIYFFLLIPVTSFFLLNVALAVVDEAREDFAVEAEEEALEEEAMHLAAEAIEESEVTIGSASRASRVSKMARPSGWMGQLVDAAEDVTRAMSKALDAEQLEEEEVPWLDTALVRILRYIATSEAFTNLIMLFIALNVVTMMLDGYPPILELQDFLATCEIVFLVIFCIEMCILLGAYGPCRYVRTPAMCFDGIIVTVSVVQVLTSPDGQGGPFTALRTFRLFRVLNKLASRWPSFRVLLKAMLYTGKSLSYWIVLFSLVLYICTLMFMQLFNRKFHFLDVDSLAEVGPDQGQAWCEGSDGLAEPFRQDCIPRANFDTFLWSLVSIFQIMTGENWNTIMYAGMRAQGWAFGGFFVGLIVFGQILFLSLFLSMLLSKFDEVQDEMEQKEAEKMSKSKNDVGTHSLRSLFRAVSTLRKIETWRDAVQEKKVAPVGEETTDMKPVVPKAGMEALGELPEGDSSDSLKRTWVWPRGYALCIFSENHAVRRLCKGILSFEVQIQGDRFKVFDNAILVCILVSCIGMASDTPLADPKATLTQIIRGGDYVFAVLFGAEMVIKLVAFGLIFSENAYLKDGWNILDGVVVIVSIVDLAVAGGGGFLKGVRILRAFRPLRIISRNQNLRVVAQTIFASLQDLLSLMVVAALFLLIFALFACSFLSGRMYHCSTETLVLLLRDQADFRTPLCLGPLDHLGSVVSGSCANGALNGKAWQENNCVNCHSTLNVSWARATVDTPICVGRCDPSIVPEEVGRQQPPEWLCPKPLTSVQQLPSVCDNRDTAEYLSNITPDELQGREYMQAMSRMLVIPCGGSTVNASGGFVEPQVVSCREAFCSEGVSSEVAQQCRVNCQGHPFFCKESCEADEQSATCQSCRRECEAACECSTFCEPLIKDAALCVEQGGRWQQALSQDFDNVFSSMLTLFEISSTEGWADVMYAACDSVGHFIEPIRNYSEWMFAPFFVVYMIFSNMFIINLSVGVIVDKFMDLKQSGKRDVILTSAQVKWLDSQKLLSRTRFFDVQDLDIMPPLRRKAYDIISSFRFGTFIMVAIALNSALMAMQTFPSQIEWWADVMYVGKRVFSGIFTLEMMLKFYALRCTYFEDSWNRFDFFCVVVSLLGIVLEDTTTLNVTGVTSVFRVLRLFRLMKYLRGVKKIFAALAASVPKLVNVMAILLLLLTLYSILGVSLFSTLKFSSENAQCNFKDFVQAFITLFRASTGEAWNEIMHDIARSPREIFASGDWCTPDYLFDPENHFEVLSEKCLIERPNGCVNSWIMGQLMPLTYWVTYTLIVAIMVMNLVIAVILESYEEGKGEKDTEIVEHCVKLWKQRDTDLKMYLPMEEAIAYIAEALNYGMELHQEENRMPIAMPELISKRLTEVPMKFINTLDLPCTEDGKVYFWHALLQVLKLLCHRWDPTLINEINSLEEMLDPDMAEKLKMDRIWESRKRQMQQAPRESILSVKDHIAALKIQHIVRDRRVVRVSESEVPKGRNHAFQDVVS